MKESPSKKAARIMSQTSGLCADPLHYHSFAAVNSSWISSPSSSLSFLTAPKCLFVGAFQKCAACGGRMGGKSADVANSCSAALSCSSNVVVTDVDGGGSFSSSGMSMLQCAACGVYAHRSCAFARPMEERTEDYDASENDEEEVETTLMPLCEVNLPLVREDLHLTPIKRQCMKKEADSSCREQQKAPTEQATDSEIPMHPPPSPPHSTSKSLSYSPWSIFGRKSHPETVIDSESPEQSAPEDVSSSGKQTTTSKQNNEPEELINTDGARHSTKQSTEQQNQSNADQTEEDIIPIALSQDKSHEIADAIISPQKTQQNETQQQIIRPVRTSIEIIRKTSQTTKSISKASAVGMVAGGVAGLAIAGPAGVVMGAQIGKTVMAVGAAVEGTVSVGVLVVSLAAAAKYGIAEKGKRELALANEAVGLGERTLVLVRPDIEVDPIWGEYAREARKSWEEMSKDSTHSSWGSGFGNLFSSFSSSNYVNSPERDARYRHDSDIVKVDSSELATRDKVFLLVNRILNDKMSLPGYVYRHLIRKHIVRSAVGDESVDFKPSPSDSEDLEVVQSQKNNSRSSRRDAHGIIKHVTAALLEVRPGLASSPSMTEMSATAVEMLVFGEIYDEVFNEISQLTKEQDDNLSVKVEKLFDHSNNFDKSLNSCCDGAGSKMVSQKAIAALGSLPEAHTSADKLSLCVEFLECVSEHFTTLYKENSGGGKNNDMNQCIDADTLLKMVCQHVIAARVKKLHAEVLFMEEFSRDEQLLRGKEGYALITLQASLHYLDSLNELQNDIFPVG
ncbi:hypothetical protein ACHAXS_012216 [Conticribra weissflogii]